MKDQNTDKDNVVQLFSPELQKAIAQRNDFINSLEGEKKKRAIEFQSKIQEALSKAGSKENRIAILQSMMRDQIFEMQKAIQKLKETLQKAQSETFKSEDASGEKEKKNHLTLL